MEIQTEVIYPSGQGWLSVFSQRVDLCLELSPAGERPRLQILFDFQ